MAQCMLIGKGEHGMSELKDWKASEFDLTYTMRSVGDYMKNQHERKELLLLNYDS